MGIIIVALLAILVFVPGPEREISSFEECVSAGNPVMESYPRQCSADGKSFTENIGNSIEKQDLIRVSSPRPNETIQSPLKITGEARGYWFFEASFPIELIDSNGDPIPLTPSHVMSASEWMTEEFVPFEGTFEFSKPTSKDGVLILKKDNPSGLPENEDTLRIPVKFGD